jgi:hypothetical protein
VPGSSGGVLHQAPSAKPGNRNAPWASCNAGRSTRPRRCSAQLSASCFTVRSSAGSWPLACAMSRP